MPTPWAIFFVIAAVLGLTHKQVGALLSSGLAHLVVAAIAVVMFFYYVGEGVNFVVTVEDGMRVIFAGG